MSVILAQRLPSPYSTRVLALLGSPALALTPASAIGTLLGMAGLDRAHVAQFEGLGFDRAKVVSAVCPTFHTIPSSKGFQIDVLRRLNYRGANVANINDDRVVEELLK